jgi:hypothetical protein
MASKPHNPTKISVYLDHSTLCDAFKAHRNRPDATDYSAYRPLRDWLERVSTEANLCLSTAHIAELAEWNDHQTADEMARWYDALQIVWTLSMFNDADAFEDEQWTKIAANANTDRRAGAFAPSLLTSFHLMSQEVAADLLASPEPVLKMMRAMRGSPQWHERWAKTYPNQFINSLVMVKQNHDASRATPGWNEGMGRDHVAHNVREDLRRRAREADLRLIRRGDAAYVVKTCLSEQVPERLVALYEREPKAMPLFRVIHRFNEGAIARIERAEIVNGVPSNRVRAALGSSFGDWIHLVGAAYCDVFSCDGTVSKWLGDLRTTFGFRPQLSVGGYPGGATAFVKDLMATWS